MTEDKFIEVCEAVLGLELEPWQESVLRVMFSAKRESYKPGGFTTQNYVDSFITYPRRAND